MSGGLPPASAFMIRPSQWRNLSVLDHLGSGSGDGLYMEKRQLFLRSYQFSRKKSKLDKARRCAVKVRRLICVRLRAARRLPQLLWFRLRRAWYSYRYGRSQRRRFRFRRLSIGHRPTMICSGGDWSCC